MDCQLTWQCTKVLLLLFKFQRIQLYNAFANSAMCENNISMLDVYPISDSYPPGTIDGIHYKDSVFDTVIDLLERYFSSSPGCKWTLQRLQKSQFRMWPLKSERNKESVEYRWTVHSWWDFEFILSHFSCSKSWRCETSILHYKLISSVC